MTGTVDRAALREPVVWAIVGCFVVEAGLDALGAYEFLGGEAGGTKARGIALAGVLIAFLGAWCGHEAVGLWRWPALRAVAAGMLAVSVLSFGLSQMAAWRVLGVSFSDGALRREVAGGNLEAWRRERQQIGIVRPMAAIEAELSLELRSTSRAYPNGDGPKALKLRSEKATAERAADLEARIAAAGASGKMVQAGAENLIVARVTGLGAESALLVVILLFTGLIGFFATFGFALREVVRGGGEGDGPGGRRRDWQDDLAPEADPFGLAQHRALLTQRVPAKRLAAPVPQARYGSLDASGPQAGYGSLDASGAQARYGGASSAAPVTINIGSGPAAAASASVPEVAVAGPSVRPRPAASSAARRGERRDLAPLPADAPPADRSAVAADLTAEERPAADVMVAFRAACVVDAPGGIVALENLFARYRHWAAERAVSVEAFRKLFPRATGVAIADIGGLPHARDVALRVGAALKVA